MDLLSRTTNTAAGNASSLKTDGAAGSPRAEAGRLLARRLAQGRMLTRSILREIMTAAHGGADTEGAWTWKDAYDAAEAAETRHLLHSGKALIAGAPQDALARLDVLSRLQPPNRMRTEESVRLQQFSTPAPYAYAAFLAAGVREGDLVLEPSAGHGALALYARLAGADLLLNEIDPGRAEALRDLFDQKIHGENAAQIDDRLGDGRRPSIVLMNPPFSQSVTRGDHAGEAAAHIISAFKRLAPGGRLVAIAPHGAALTSAAYARFFRDVFAAGRLRLAAGMAAGVYARKGAAVETRLLVIDKLGDETGLDGGADKPAMCEPGDLISLLQRIETMPARAGVVGAAPRRMAQRRPAAQPPAPIRTGALFAATRRHGDELSYETRAPEIPSADRHADGIYQPYRVARIFIPDAKPHPTLLTQSAALASVAPPVPSYRPHLPGNLVADGVLSDAQLESIVYAGEAHSRRFAGWFTRNRETGEIGPAAEDAPGAFRLRKGYFIGDGTGCGKGRQIAGVLLDNWIKGRRRAVWVSRSDKLKEDAVRDWTALGGGGAEIVPQSRYRLGARISLREGILFTTFSTLRGGERDGKASRLDQLLDWLGEDFDGVIAFDEAHAMQNAAAEKGDRGIKKASLQGRAGVELQLRAPDARVLYASATGASAVENLAYAERLGLWRGQSAPFSNREQFISEMNKGGVAAMEMVCRDLKAMGLYCARNLSFEGVEYDFLDHDLTPEQIAIYDSYAEAFKVIHHNLEAALEAAGAVEEGVSKNRNAVSAARSAFESTKQRFFNHLLTAMKMPTLTRAIRRDLEEGLAPVVQIVSTGEAVMERRLAALSAEDLGSGNFDLTPREAVMDYLVNSFPVQLYQMVVQEDGSEVAEPVLDASGAPVLSQEALERRAAMIEHLGALPPVTSALDQLIWTFGPEKVAEITGRRRRVLRIKELGHERAEIENRPASVNLAETDAFMDNKKSVLVFSEAGGTGRSYHADLGRPNQKRRSHYLLEAGWKADAAIQGLGRSHRTHQASPPLFRPVATNVKGEKRFLSTIARRLDALGALTKGERQTGGQGMFRTEDNLESQEAQDALRIFFRRLAHEPQGGISLPAFEELTGLSLTDKDGALKENLPPIRKFLNRLLALPIATQNILFGVFEEIVETRVEAARLAGTLDIGAETITADSLQVRDAHILRTDPETGAETRLLRIARRTRNHPRLFDEMIAWRSEHGGAFHVNAKSGRTAFVTPARPITDEATGAVLSRVELIRPNDRQKILRSVLDESAWELADDIHAAKLWNAEVDATPAFTENEFGLVAGLILPIWSLLAAKRPTVYRLTDDDGATHLGRYIAPAAIAPLMKACGLQGAAADLTPDDVNAALARGESIALAGGVTLCCSRVMDRQRIEVRNYPAERLAELKALGCFTEIISWRTRVFVPSGDMAGSVLKALLERFDGRRLAA